MSDIEQCQDLIAQIGDAFENEDRFTIAADKIIQTSTMALWAQSPLGERKIDMGLPSLKAWLGRLAESGPGPAEEYQGISYKFVKRKFLI